MPELLQLREKGGITERPLIVWEPLPAACTTPNAQSFLEAVKLVDVFSPNHIEIEGIFTERAYEKIDTNRLESYGQALLDSSIGPNGDGAVIIRAGEDGALSMSRTSRPTWFPAYYEKDSPEVVDPTGAGNAFLGGYIAGWQQTCDIHKAMWYGHVAASFALEQIGLPRHDSKNGEALWNGVTVADRLEEYRKRVRDTKVLSDAVV